MLAFRVIARLDIKAPHLVKTVRLEGVRRIGHPATFARRYDAALVDELLYLDVVASLYGRNCLGPLLDDVTADVFVPVTAGGGVRSADDVRHLLNHGADKIAVNTAALARPALIDEIATKFGASTLTVQIDAKRTQDGWEAYGDGGRQRSGKDGILWAQEAADRGAGEILLTGIDREGTGRGLDLDLVAEVSARLSVPVVAAGGAGCADDAVAAWRAGASGIALAKVLHFDIETVSGIKAALRGAGAAVRI